ncbi:MAG: hypothetical protein D4R44_02890 [Actinobacteria bacterium]|nr:MAG: hypothetical protein D4R44_02890 [Actinomycetota bacterium]
MAVASQSLALIGLALLCIVVGRGQNIFLRSFAILGVLFIFAGTFRWYGAQGDFFDGQPWRNLTDKAVADCRTSLQENPLIINGISTVDLTCVEITQWG